MKRDVKQNWLSLPSSLCVAEQKEKDTEQLKGRLISSREYKVSIRKKQRDIMARGGSQLFCLCNMF